MPRRVVSGTVIIAVILVGLFSSLTKLSMIEEISSSNQASASLVSDYQNVTTHEGDLVINGTQTFVVENCTYVQIGNIDVRDNGKLIIRNAIFIVNQTYGEQYAAVIEGYGGLEIENSEITTSYGMAAYTRGFSKVTIKHAKVTSELSFYFSGQSITIINSTLFFFEWRNSYISVVNSTINVIGIHFYANYVLTIDDLKRNLYQFWEFRPDATYLILENTTVKGWKLRFVSNSMVTVTNSELHNVELQFDDSMTEINGLKAGRYGFWNLQTNESVRNVSYDLTLKNTSVEHWTIIVLGSSKVDIFNTTDAHIASFGQGKVHIENSNVEFFHIGEDAEGIIINSRISGLWFYDFHGNAFFNKTEVEIGPYYVHHSDFYLSGDFTFIQRNVKFSYVSSKITRNFNLIARDISDNPMENAKLTLFNQNYAVIWNGTTDGLGRANFNITFSDGNYTDWSQLNVCKEGFYNFTSSISLLSNTPVIISLTEKPLGDINEDRTVNIVDVTLVARSFGCVPTDVGWNELCDLNNDDMINIVDITLVAKDYGTTV